MVYYALSCVEDAVDATRAFLVPVDRRRWLKLAVVVFFLSGGSGVSSMPNVSWNVQPSDFDFLDGATWSGPPAELFDSLLPVVVGLAIVFALLGIVFAFVGSVMEFVLVESLRTESVRVRASMRKYLGAGFALFLFRLLLIAIVLAVLGGLALLFVVPALDGNAVAIVVGGLLLVVVGGAVALLAAIVHGFTTNFVVPTMIHEERGLRSAWRRFWPVLRGNLGQFAVYVVVRFALTIGVGIVAGIAVSIAAAIIAIPFLLLGGSLWVGFGGVTTVGSAVAIGLVVALYVLVLLALTAVVQVPLKTFTRYYELLVLGDIDPELDLVAERRAAVRGEGDA